MALALETGGYGMLATTYFLGMGDVASKDAFEWLMTDPKILRGSKIYFEQKRGHVASAIECYMKQHGAAERETERELQKMISDAWKDINEECLRPTPFPIPILTRILNFARVIEVLYKGKDRYTDLQTDMKDYVAALLVDPIPL
ncbi:hypothetical protein CRG98_011844 [Punica granatum]|uniref:Terpene synthase metal-binding domain-containing protein n=1 Tax=Punica granatum TaxID=22663 RepID=A0A2I0KGL5_PUNGR|nr:hypothetical protein CRG98_011844 [Punica granatum]